MSPEPLVVIIRGPMGAGKSTLLHGLARVKAFGFYVLDADAAGAFHPSDPHGEHLDDEWPLEVEILALHAKIISGRGLNLITDPGELLARREVDRFLRVVGRSRKDPRVVLPASRSRRRPPWPGRPRSARRMSGRATWGGSRRRSEGRS